MRFPLADWIDDHAACRHNLGQSGMVGSIRRPALTREERRATDPAELVSEIARTVRVDPRRVALTHGATEANAWVTVFLSRPSRRSRRRCRVRLPEYPPLFDVARWSGFAIGDDRRPAGLAIVSRPRNPEGDLWSRDRLFAWSEDADHLLVDETFREFARAPSIASESRRGLWATGTLTKFYGADDLRVGFVLAPPELAGEFARFVGLVTDKIPDSSVAGALSTLRHHAEIASQVHRLLERNRAALRRKSGGIGPAPLAPVFFDRPPAEPGDRLARRALRRSVLVCPGSYFGDPSGVRVGMTRRSFPRDLDAYWEVRSRGAARPPTTGRAAGRGAPPRPGERARGRDARS
jgi:aspartate/methionine/tyrosine aminotransferase